MLPSPDKATEV